VFEKNSNPLKKKKKPTSYGILFANLQLITIPTHRAPEYISSTNLI
jgi:hypothetical protein